MSLLFGVLWLLLVVLRAYQAHLDQMDEMDLMAEKEEEAPLVLLDLLGQQDIE